jgi:hypothetical protein
MQNEDWRLLGIVELARILNVPVSWVRTHAHPSAKTRLPAKKDWGSNLYSLLFKTIVKKAGGKLSQE